MVSLVLSAAVAAMGQSVRTAVRRLRGAGAVRQHRRRLSRHDARLRADLQVHPARPCRVEGRLDRRARHRAAVHDRQAADRAVHRQEWRRLGLRRGELDRRAAGLGLLLGADLPARRGIHLGLRAHARLAARPRAAAGAARNVTGSRRQRPAATRAAAASLGGRERCGLNAARRLLGASSATPACACSMARSARCTASASPASPTATVEKP